VVARHAQVVVGQGAAGATEDPGEGEGEADPVEQAQDLVARHPAAPGQDDPRRQPAQHAAERGHAAPDAQQLPRVAHHALGVVEQGVEEVAADEAPQDDPGHEARGGIGVEPQARRPAHHDLVPHDDGQAHQHLEGVDGVAPDLERGLLDVRDHGRSLSQGRGVRVGGAGAAEAPRTG
jgi:hypothetical protein